MREPSENFRRRLRTFHSRSVGGRLVGLLKKISYSIFRRRMFESRTTSSSSIVKRNSPPRRIGRDGAPGEVPQGQGGYGTKVPGKQQSALSIQYSAFSTQERQRHLDPSLRSG